MNVIICGAVCLPMVQNHAMTWKSANNSITNQDSRGGPPVVGTFITHASMVCICVNTEPM